MSFIFWCDFFIGEVGVFFVEFLFGCFVDCLCCMVDGIENFVVVFFWEWMLDFFIIWMN